jgi:hypothetical protein
VLLGWAGWQVAAIGAAQVRPVAVAVQVCQAKLGSGWAGCVEDRHKVLDSVPVG